MIRFKIKFDDEQLVQLAVQSVNIILSLKNFQKEFAESFELRTDNFLEKIWRHNSDVHDIVMLLTSK